jgi:hypothetical protein
MSHSCMTGYDQVHPTRGTAMSQTPVEPEARPTDEPDVTPSSDPDGGSTVMPTEPSVTNPDAAGSDDAASAGVGQ